MTNPRKIDIRTTAGLIAICISFAHQGCSRCLAQGVVAQPSPSAPLTNAQQRLLKYIDPLLDAAWLRVAPGDACLQRISERAGSLFDNRSFDKFVEEVLSIGSKTKQATNHQAWTKWIRDRYLTIIFPLDEFKAIVRSEIDRFERDLDEIDNTLLVRLSLDIDIERMKSRVVEPKIEFAKLDALVEQAIGKIVPRTRNANVADASTFAAATAVSAVAQDKVADAMRDEKGNLSWSACIGSFAVGLVADQAVTAIAEHVTDTSAELRTAVVEATSTFLRGYLADGPAFQERVQHLLARKHRHDMTVLVAVALELGVDIDWALDEYLRAYERRFIVKKNP